MARGHAGKTSTLSEEFVRDSDEDHHDSNYDAAKTDGASSDSDADNGSDVEANSPEAGKSNNAASQKSDRASDTDSESSNQNDASKEEPEQVEEEASKDNDSGNGSDSDDSDASRASSKRGREEDDGDGTEAAKRQKTNKGPVKIASKKFTAPAGFGPLVLGPSDFASNTAEIFSNLDGKQVWHISAPLSLSIASVKNLDLEAAMRGEAILTENGISYSMRETSSKHEALMLLADSSAQYRQSRVAISKSFKLGVKSEAESKVSSRTESQRQSPKKIAVVCVATEDGQKKLPRQQPDGLQMRYQPFGSGTAKAPHETTASPSRKTPITSSNSHSSAGKSVGKSFVIADPVLFATASSKNSTKHVPKPVLFSGPTIGDGDEDMEDAPTPSKSPAKGRTTSTAPPSRRAGKAKSNATTPKDSSQGTTKKQRRAKLVDGPTL